MSECYAEGFMAVDEGLTRGENPHYCSDNPADPEDWEAGFDDATREKEKREAKQRRDAIGTHAGLLRLDAMSVEDIAQAIGLPVEQWPGNCYAVAVKMNEKLQLGLTPCYGHFSGWVHRASMFSPRMQSMGVVNHGWLATDDGVIVDPTRFVFENQPAGIYIGREHSADYERGGNSALDRMLGGRPRPAFDPTQELKILPVLAAEHASACAWVIDQLEQSRARPQHCAMTAELFWLCNRPPQWMVATDGQPMAAPFYRLAQALGFGAFIPIENRLMVLGERDEAAGDDAIELDPEPMPAPAG